MPRVWTESRSAPNDWGRVVGETMSFESRRGEVLLDLLVLESGDRL